MALTIDEKNGIALYATTDDVNYPVDYSFEAINNFVHAPGIHFEELQYVCLGMSAKMDEIKKRLEIIYESQESTPKWVCDLIEPYL